VGVHVGDLGCERWELTDERRDLVAEWSEGDEQRLGDDHHDDGIDDEDGKPARDAAPCHPLDGQVEEIGKDEADDEWAQRRATEIQDRDEEDGTTD
jgi:hypothetical protein